jgi:hypothetical protein
MSDWSLLSGDPSGDDVATSTKSDDGFKMVTYTTISTTGVRNANVATWLQTQFEADTFIEASPQSNSVPPYASKTTDNTVTIANQAASVPNLFKKDELLASKTTADLEAPTMRTETSPKAIIEDQATATIQKFPTKVDPKEKTPNTSMTRTEATITPKTAVAARQGSTLFKQVVRGSKTSKIAAKPISGEKNEESSIGSMPNHKLLKGFKRGVSSISSANLRHCVIIITSNPFTMPSKVSAGVDARYEKEGIIGMLNDILWANVYLLDDPKSSFWKEVLRAASAKIPLAMNCWVMVEGCTERVKKILKMRNVLKCGNKKLFNGDAFFFTFSKGMLNWEYLGAEPDFHNLLEKRGAPSIVYHGFQRRSSKVQIHGHLEYRLANV